MTGPISFSRCGASPSCTTWLTTVAPMRLRKPRPLLPMATACTLAPAPCTSRIFCVTSRSRLVLRPPHRPLSVVTTMKATALGAPSTSRMYGLRYSGLACDRLVVMTRILSLYGRAWRMRSCALRIFEAATISMALVIFLVFSTDLILTRISLPAAISMCPQARCRPRGSWCCAAGDPAAQRCWRVPHVQAKLFLNAAIAPASSSSAALSIALSASNLASSAAWLDLRYWCRPLSKASTRLTSTSSR